MSVDYIKADKLSYDAFVYLHKGDERIDVTEYIDLDRSDINYLNGDDIGTNANLKISVLDINKVPEFSTVSIETQVTDDLGGVYRTKMGTYLLEAPTSVIPLCDGDTNEMVGDDLTVYLDQPIGYSWVAPGGRDAVGEAAKVVDSSPGPITATFPLPKPPELLPDLWVWLIGQNNTWRCVADMLLERAGYRLLWMDRDGSIISDEKIDPLKRAEIEDIPHWNVDEGGTFVSSGFTRERDLKGHPNRWRVIREDLALVSDATTIEHVVETRENKSNGPASFDERGYWLTEIIEVDVTSIRALSQIADKIQSVKQYPVEQVELSVAPQLYLWHDDLVYFTSRNLEWDRVLCAVEAWNHTLSGNELMPVRLRRLR